MKLLTQNLCRARGVAPSRGRGLKRLFGAGKHHGPRVAPSRGRGLKPASAFAGKTVDGRPLTGARIETASSAPTGWSATSPPHGGAD